MNLNETIDFLLESNEKSLNNFVKLQDQVIELTKVVDELRREIIQWK